MAHTAQVFVAKKYLRHDAREVKHLSCDVGQITVQENKEWLNHSDIMREAGSESRYESQEDADQHSTNAHDKEVSNSSKHINGLNGFHLAKGLEQVIQDLWKQETCGQNIAHPPGSLCIQKHLAFQDVMAVL